MYVPCTRKIISSYYVVFYESFSSTLAYTSQPYAEAMNMRQDVSYTPYATSSRGGNGNIIKLAYSEKVNLLSETHNLSSETRKDVESGYKYDDGSTMPPLISEEEIDAMSSGDESDDELMSTDMLEDIREDSQSRPIVNMIEVHYKIRDCI